ncbi:MAG: hypothetical protein FWG40_00565 [Peptococcaceae bacterium]|nr:hypothetical protein [Peptococcaceae bacterium]
MNEIKTVKFHMLSRALAPITHMMGSEGNESVINRTNVYHDGHVHAVPVLSGNAIRHKMVREPGAMLIVNACGLYGKLNIDQANYLFYGGSLTESSVSDNLQRIAEMQELMPLVRLLGGSLKNQIVSGSLSVSMGILVCRENRGTLELCLPDELLAGLPELRSCEDFVSGWQYTRSDARKKPELLDMENAAEAAEDKSNLMIYNGQHVIPGAMFYHDFILHNVSRLEVGALWACLKDWEASGGVIGGSSRIGHGRLKTEAYVGGENVFGDEIDLDAYEAEYREHTANNADKIKEWLDVMFGTPIRGQKKSKKSTQAEVLEVANVDIDAE